MAIRTGIEPGAVLWKYSQMERAHVFNPETRVHEVQEQERYYIIELYNRRSRTNGYAVEESLYPFLKSINVRLIQQNYYDYGRQRDVRYYVAVGTRRRRIANKEEWEALEIHELASKWYAKLRNDKLSALLDKRYDLFSEEILMDLEVPEEVEDTSEPEEPNMPEFSLQVRSGYYHQVNW